MTSRPLAVASATAATMPGAPDARRVPPRLLPPRTAVRAPATARIAVLLCEDQSIYLAGLRSLLAAHPEITVVGEAVTVAGACRLAERTPCQVAVVRQGLLNPADHGPLRQLASRGIAVLVLAESDSRTELARALQAGARGYLSRRLSDQQLLDSIRALARGEPAFDAAVTRHLMEHLIEQPVTAGDGPVASGPLEGLTEQQRRVALLVAEGLTNDEVAARLHLGRTTVKSHLAQVMRRLGVHSRTQLAILVNRLPEPDPTA